MAYLSMLRELQHCLRQTRDRLPVACLLCGRRSAGGFCRYCRQAVTADHEEAGRCPRCAVALSGMLAEGIVEQAMRRISRRLGVAPRHTYPDCPDCSSLSPALEYVIAAFDYHWPGDLLIERLKVHGRFSCAVVLADLLAKRCQAALAGHRSVHSMLVTAVPASRRSLVLRGFNPAAELGRSLAFRLGMQWQPALIRRVQEGQGQKSLGRRERRREVEGLYRCGAAVQGRAVLIVDDVMTTGATLSVIADLLHQQGASMVWAAVAARTPSRLQTPESVR